MAWSQRMVLYLSHSWRPEDFRITKYVLGLILNEDNVSIMVDRRSPRANSAKLQMNMQKCDGMVAVLPWRSPIPSQYILWEIELAKAAGKPTLVFADDRLEDAVLPDGVLLVRFSHTDCSSDERDHADRLKELQRYIRPGPRFHVGTRQRTCGMLGTSSLTAGERFAVVQFFSEQGYRAVDLDSLVLHNPPPLRHCEHPVLDVAVHFVDSETADYWAGMIDANATPTIAFTRNPDYPYREDIPGDLQPRLVESGVPALVQAVQEELSLANEEFREASGLADLEGLLEEEVPRGRYRMKPESHSDGGQPIVRINVTNSNIGVIGEKVSAKEIIQNNNYPDKFTLMQLAAKLGELRAALESDEAAHERKAEIEALRAAERSAGEQDGPAVMKFLRQAGNWALTIAQKVGQNLAQEWINKALSGERG